VYKTIFALSREKAWQRASENFWCSCGDAEFFASKKFLTVDYFWKGVEDNP